MAKPLPFDWTVRENADFIGVLEQLTESAPARRTEGRRPKRLGQLQSCYRTVV